MHNIVELQSSLPVIKEHATYKRIRSLHILKFVRHVSCHRYLLSAASVSKAQERSGEFKEKKFQVLNSCIMRRHRICIQMAAQGKKEQMQQTTLPHKSLQS